MTHEGQISENEMKFADDAVTPEVFIVCCGTRDSVVGTYPKQYHELLKSNGADHNDTSKLVKTRPLSSSAIAEILF